MFKLALFLVIKIQVLDACSFQLFSTWYELISAEDWSYLILQSEINDLFSLNAFLP